MPDNKHLLREYLSALFAADLTTVATRISEDFDFASPFVRSRGKAEFIKQMQPLAPIVRGFDLHKLVAEGDELCATYTVHVETPKGKGSVAMAEWVTLRQGLVSVSRVFFDTPQLTKLL